ncbi:MAG: rane protein [Mycobacterium sp.]|nr:rane protein [Mycobacterium sp.]
MVTVTKPRATLRGTALLVGLTGYGFSMAMMVRAGFGLDPWDVFHQGLSRHTGMTIGIASAVVGVAVLLAWIPLRNRPGVGTIANVIVIAITVDAGMALLPPPSAVPVRVALMSGAVLLNAASTVLYVGAGLGPGPRDGLMTGIVVRTGLSVRLVRTGIEAAALGAGWLLGGSVGFGTVVYAFGIGPLVQLMLRVTPDRVLARSGWAAVAESSDLGVPRSGQHRSTRRNRKSAPAHATTSGYGTMVECPTPATMQSTPTC